MEYSEKLNELAVALGQFQYTVGTIKKDGTNPFFKSKYATLENIIEHIKDPLAKNKLTFSQMPDGEGLTTIIMHESGQWIRAWMHIHMGLKPQEQGSALTYARRYALCAALGLAVDEDDDGNAASQKPVEAPKQVAPAPKTALKTSDKGTMLRAAADRVMSQLKILGLPDETPELRRASIEQAAKMKPIATDLDNMTLIGDRLEALIEEVKKSKK